MVKPPKLARFEIHLVCLDPTFGAEMKKTRPCVIISPDEMNHALKTIIIAPMTTTCRSYPTRVSIVLHDKSGQIALDQMRTIDSGRLVKKLGVCDKKTQTLILSALEEIFA